jgi:hypothetical protein
MKSSNLIYKFLCFSIVLPCISSAQTGTDSASPIKHVEIVVAYDWGWDLNDTKQNKCIYVTTVNSKGDLSTYNATPQHQAILKSKAVKSITTIDYPVNK